MRLDDKTLSLIKELATKTIWSDDSSRWFAPSTESTNVDDAYSEGYDTAQTELARAILKALGENTTNSVS
jgi:hypothetical protein